MKDFLLYFLQVVLVSGVLYSYYHFFLRNKRFHQYNRFYLLIASVLSLVIPLLQIDIYFSSRQDIPVIYQLMADVRAGNAIDFDSSSSMFSWQKFVQLILGLVIMILLIRLVISLVYINRLKKNNDAEKLDDILFINTEENGTPFSFFRWLFWNKKIGIESDAGQKIFRHELFHIQQNHSRDIIYLELLTAIFWINPFFHLIKKETRAIHEFLADRFAAGHDNKWEYAELLVMQTLQTHQRLVNPFFHNQIKRRIAMITNSSKPGFQYLRKVMVLPLIFLVVTIVAVNCTSKDIKDVTQTDSKNKKAEENEALKEKIITLSKIEKDSEAVKYIAGLKEKLASEAEDKLYVEIRGEIPVFDGGRPAWQKFLQKTLNANVPVDNGAPAGTYTVVTTFMVDENGKLNDIKATTHFGYGMEQEVLRVLKLSPPWTPAMKNGHAVKGYTKQPVTFSITAE